MSEVCVFCRIVAGEIPAVKLFEDDAVLAFLDIAPINKGHLLIIPKTHFFSLTSVPPEIAGRLMTVASVLGKAVTRAVGADGFNLILANGSVAGQVVPHVHLHLVPRFPADGVIIPARSVKYDSDAEKETIAAEIRRRAGGSKE